MTALVVRPGPRLLAGPAAGPGLAEHRRQYGDLPRLDKAALVALAEEARLRGRGGAGFPFAVKLATAGARRRAVVVVNLSEGEPASWKDAALALTRPHLVLDGALLAARALGARQVHLVVPGGNGRVRDAVARAVVERPERIRFTLHVADDRFVAGQARAVLELMAGRPNAPVTAWQPAAVRGHQGRPTLLSNAETWAQLACFALPGTAAYDESTLLTLDGEAAPVVVEVPVGTPWGDVLPERWPDEQALLVGGYHGTWTTAGRLRTLPVCRDALAAAGITLGAGAVVPVRAGECPVMATARLTAYLAGESAGRCGPCLNGLPALAAAVSALARGEVGDAQVEQLAGLVERRGACAHPDGTARLVRSLLRTFADDVAAHAAGNGCPAPRGLVAVTR